MKLAHRYPEKYRLLLVLICVCALAIRIWLLFVLQPWDEEVLRAKVVIGDAAQYHYSAVNFMATTSFVNFSPFLTPGYPILLVFIYSLFGFTPWAALVIQIFLDIGVILITYLIAKEIFTSEAVALIAALLYAISFPSAYYSIRLLSEIPFAFLFAVTVFIFMKSLKEERLAGFALTGLLLGLASYLRVAALYFPAVLFVIIAMNGGTVAVKVKRSLVILILVAIALFPWHFRNLQVYGNYAFTTKGGRNLYLVNSAIVKAHKEKISRLEATAQLRDACAVDGIDNPYEKSKIFLKYGISYVSKHPADYLKYHTKGIVKMFLGTTRSGITELFGVAAEPPVITESLRDITKKIVGNLRSELPNIILFVKQVAEYLFALLGLAIMWREKRSLHLILLVLIILYFANVTGIIGYSRFRIPIIPFYLILSAKGIYETVRFVKAKKRPPVRPQSS